MMNKILLPLLVFCPFLTIGQNWEAGILLGGANYNGDLNYEPINLSETNYAGGLIGRYNVSEHLSFRGNLLYGLISGTDENAPESSTWRKRRNLSFRSRVIEASVVMELNILPYVSNSISYRFAPYVFLGIGVFNFNPETEYMGDYVELQPLGTEGQGTPGGPDPYSLISASIPLGIGAKFSLGNFWNLGMEVGARKTFTDYLDDVSDIYADPDAILNENGPVAVALADRSREIPQYRDHSFEPGSPRGNPETEDWYIFAGITLTKSFVKSGCLTF